jgi:hypothetical protein
LEDGLEDEMVGWRWKSLIWKGWKEVGTNDGNKRKLSAKQVFSDKELALNS